MLQSVLLIGADPGVGERFPLPYVDRQRATLLPEAILVDAAMPWRLTSTHCPAAIEIGWRRAKVVEIIDGYGSFFGTPFVFTSYRDAVRYLRWPGDATVFLVVRLHPGTHSSSFKRAMQSQAARSGRVDAR